MKQCILVVSVLAVVLMLAAAAAVGFGFYWFSVPGPLQQEKVVVIEPGTGFKAITDRLQREGVIDRVLPFQAMVLWHDKRRDFKAGEYRFTPAMSPRQVMEKMVAGRSVSHAITIPEGLTTREIIALLMQEDRLSGAMPTGVAEGSLMPDTYYFHRGEPRRSIVRRMRQAMQETLEQLWRQRASNVPLASKHEALTLASIVEAETGIDLERGRVAAVFINRLRRGMRLQSDPTVIYAIEQENGPMQRPLWRSDWELEHPYNTYVIDGLPPGPIVHPGRAAIKAVLNPPHTDELFFVATGTGGHFFARTLKEHNANVARYRARQRDRQRAREEE